ncbi:uncharacterized protein LOC131165847 [Malania oleifera]|uniref:uncharacterized protein LOC131165847 n=1 Tax=Malania oleifera TaxID=397392 RepID=UPI0025AE11AF|nr:uncharacterized protein LOC131165847 [Malania oleifera]
MPRLAVAAAEACGPPAAAGGGCILPLVQPPPLPAIDLPHAIVRLRCSSPIPSSSVFSFSISRVSHTRWGDAHLSPQVDARQGLKQFGPPHILVFSLGDSIAKIV